MDSEALQVPIQLPARHLPQFPELPWKDILYDDIQFYPELYLTVLMYLGYTEPDHLPKRRSIITSAEVAGNGYSITVDRRLQDLADVLAAITIEKPGGNVYAVGLVNTAKSSPKIIVGGNSFVEDKVEILFYEIWKILQDIGSCYASNKGDAATMVSTDEDSPPKKLRGGDITNYVKKLKVSLEKLLETMVAYAREKIRARFRKYVTVLCEVTDLGDAGGWKNESVKNMTEVLRDTAIKIAYDESGNPLETGLLLHRTFERIVKIASNLAAGGIAESDEQSVEYLVSVAEAEFTSLAKRLPRSHLVMKNFDIRRIMKKSFSVLSSWKIMHKVARSSRMHHSFLVHPIQVIRLRPQQRLLPNPITPQHVELLIAKALMKSGEDEDYIERILKSERVLKLFDKMQLTLLFERCEPKYIDKGTKVNLQRKPQTERSVMLNEGASIYGAGETLATDNIPKEEAELAKSEVKSTKTQSSAQGESLPATASTIKTPREESKVEKPTKGDISGYQAAVRYECLVLHKLRELTLGPSSPSPYPYVGISRLCCFFCVSFFEFYNKYAGKTKFYVKGCHQKVYDRITAPMLTPELDRRIETQMIERLRCEIVRQLELPGKDKVRSLSKSSVEENWGQCEFYEGDRIHGQTVEDNDEKYKKGR